MKWEVEGEGGGNEGEGEGMGGRRGGDGRGKEACLESVKLHLISLTIISLSTEPANTCNFVGQIFVGCLSPYICKFISSPTHSFYMCLRTKIISYLFLYINKKLNVRFTFELSLCHAQFSTKKVHIRSRECANVSRK